MHMLLYLSTIDSFLFVLGVQISIITNAVYNIYIHIIYI